jgi:hypothetical protein
METGAQKTRDHPRSDRRPRAHEEGFHPLRGETTAQRLGVAIGNNPATHALGTLNRAQP